MFCSSNVLNIIQSVNTDFGSKDHPTFTAGFQTRNAKLTISQMAKKVINYRLFKPTLLRGKKHRNVVTVKGLSDNS